MKILDKIKKIVGGTFIFSIKKIKSPTTKKKEKIVQKNIGRDAIIIKK